MIYVCVSDERNLCIKINYPYINAFLLSSNKLYSRTRTNMVKILVKKLI